MNYLRNERGIALVTALMLTLVSLVLVMALMYFIETGTRVSAAAKRYQNVQQAAYGGVSLTVNELIPRLENAIFGNYSSGTQSGIQKLKTDYANLTLPDLGCLKQKLNSSSATWSSACSKSLDPKSSPDMTFLLKSTLSNTLQPAQGYVVYTKIVDTPIVGNTDPANLGNLRKPENVNESLQVEGNGVTIPTTYRIEVRAERQQNPQEKSNLTVLYAY
ncbi:MAG TPA: pilus assembly PilX N-terminal domain-containing protein [Geobacteraceae bacterium]|nr:pilus assembly PilX N-terminal domain-containing protein [Geobacteraceae bacterium]